MGELASTAYQPRRGFGYLNADRKETSPSGRWEQRPSYVGSGTGTTTLVMVIPDIRDFRNIPIRGNLIRPFFDAHTAQVLPINMSVIISEAKLKLGLPDKDLAQLFRLSRQQLFNYRKDNIGSVEPQEITLKRARQIHSIVQSLSAIFLQSPSHALKNIIIDGNTLFELLDTGQPDINTIKTFAYELEKIIATRRNRHANSATTDIDRALAIHQMTR